VCCSHCGTIGESNGVLGSDQPLVDTRGLMANKVFGASRVGYAVSGKGGN
jgi:hypothetical protein